MAPPGRPPTSPLKRGGGGEAEADHRGVERASIDSWQDAGPWIAERLNARPPR